VRRQVQHLLSEVEKASAAAHMRWHQSDLTAERCKTLKEVEVCDWVAGRLRNILDADDEDRRPSTPV